MTPHFDTFQMEIRGNSDTSTADGFIRESKTYYLNTFHMRPSESSVVSRAAARHQITDITQKSYVGLPAPGSINLLESGIGPV